MAMKKYLSRFFVRKQDEKKEWATLFFRVQNRKLKLDSIVSSKLKVNVSEWKEAVSSSQKWLRHQSAHSDLHASLAKIEYLIKSKSETIIYDKEKIEHEILVIVDPEKAAALMKAKLYREDQQRCKEEQEREKLCHKNAEKEVQRANIWNYIMTFCTEIESGKRLYGNAHYADGTIGSWRCFRKIYNKFDAEHRFTWNDISHRFVAEFIAFMEQHNYMPLAQNKYLTSFRTVVSSAFKEHIHEYNRAAGYFTKKKIKDEDKAAEIYLSESELQALYEMPLTGKKEEVRDIFLVGCYTCQRVSDFNNIKRENFTTTAKGTPIIRLVQKKTGSTVKIPIINKNLKALCEKYNYNLPSPGEVIINKYIKQILEKLSVKVPTLSLRVRTVLTMRQKTMEKNGILTIERDSSGYPVLPRYKCVTTHTARRSGITNMYLTHKYTIFQIMHVSGHRTQRTFMDYIKLSSDEIADEIDAIANVRTDDMF